MGFELPPAVVNVVFITGSGTYVIVQEGLNNFLVKVSATVTPQVGIMDGYIQQGAGSSNMQNQFVDIGGT